MVDLVTAIRSVRAEMNIPPATLMPLVLVGASTETQGRAERWSDVIKRLARLADISFVERAPDGAMQLLVRGEVAALPLKGVIDLAAEKARLDKEMAKADADIKRVDAKLGNDKFVANAPEEVVEEEREKREEAVARRAKIVEALERLKARGVTTQETTRRPSSFGALFLLWLAGNALRLTILAVPPILALIILDLGLSGTDVGVLNAIPVALFALIAIPGSLLIARVGAVHALVVGLLIAAVGSALRGIAFDTVVLYAATVVMSAGVALMQPALPPLVREWVPDRIGFATAIYTNGLLCGEIVPVVLVGAIMAFLGGKLAWQPDFLVGGAGDDRTHRSVGATWP